MSFNFSPKRTWFRWCANHWSDPCLRGSHQEPFLQKYSKFQISWKFCCFSLKNFRSKKYFFSDSTGFFCCCQVEKILTNPDMLEQLTVATPGLSSDHVAMSEYFWLQWIVITVYDIMSAYKAEGSCCYSIVNYPCTRYQHISKSPPLSFNLPGFPNSFQVPIDNPRWRNILWQ